MQQEDKMGATRSESMHFYSGKYDVSGSYKAKDFDVPCQEAECDGTIEYVETFDIKLSVTDTSTGKKVKMEEIPDYLHQRAQQEIQAQEPESICHDCRIRNEQSYEEHCDQQYERNLKRMENGE